MDPKAPTPLTFPVSQNVKDFQRGKFRYFQCMLREEQPRRLGAITEQELEPETCMYQAYSWKNLLLHLKTEHNLRLEPIIDYCG